MADGQSYIITDNGEVGIGVHVEVKGASDAKTALRTLMSDLNAIAKKGVKIPVVDSTGYIRSMQKVQAQQTKHLEKMKATRDKYLKAVAASYGSQPSLKAGKNTHGRGDFQIGNVTDVVKNNKKQYTKSLEEMILAQESAHKEIQKEITKSAENAFKKTQKQNASKLADNKATDKKITESAKQRDAAVLASQESANKKADANTIKRQRTVKATGAEITKLKRSLSGVHDVGHIGDAEFSAIEGKIEQLSRTQKSLAKADLSTPAATSAVSQLAKDVGSVNKQYSNARMTTAEVNAAAKTKLETMLKNSSYSDEQISRMGYTPTDGSGRDILDRQAEYKSKYKELSGKDYYTVEDLKTMDSINSSWKDLGGSSRTVVSNMNKADKMLSSINKKSTQLGETLNNNGIDATKPGRNEAEKSSIREYNRLLDLQNGLERGVKTGRMPAGLEQYGIEKNSETFSAANLAAFNAQMREFDVKKSKIAATSSEGPLSAKDARALNSIGREMSRYNGQYGEMFNKNAEYKEKFSNLYEGANSGQYNGGVKQLRNDWTDLQRQIRKSGFEVETFKSKMNRMFGVRFKSALAGMSIFGMQAALVDMAKNVVDVDTAMTELKKVTDESDETYSKFYDNATVRAKKYGATLTDTIDATSRFAKLGYNIEDASTMANAAIVYKNVGDNITDASVATDSIISTIQGFDIKAGKSMEIVDKFNEVGNRYPVGSDEIGVGMQKSAAALHAGGNNLDQSIAMFTAANSVVQDAEVTGTALKTMAMRMRASKLDATKSGVDTEGMATSKSELRDKLQLLTGVDIMKNKDTYLTQYDMYRKISKNWGGMSDINRASALELMFGKRQANVGAALLQNSDMMESAYKTSKGSKGSALKENQKILDSTQGHIKRFQASWQSFSNTLLNNDLLKGLISTATGLMNVFDGLVSKMGSLQTIIVSVLTVLSQMGKIKKFDFLNFNKETGKFSAGAQSKAFTEGVTGAYYSKFGSDKQKAAVKQRRAARAAANVSVSTDTSSEKHQYTELDAMANANVRAKMATEELNAAQKETNRSFEENSKTTKTATQNNKTMTASIGGVTSETSKSTSATKTSSKIRSMAGKAGSVAVNSLATFGIGAAASIGIEMLIKGITWLAEADERAVKAGEKVTSTYDNATSKATKNITDLKGYQTEFSGLAEGVNDAGQNVGLTTDQFERYHEIVNKIAKLSPTLVKGYDAEGNAIAKNKNIINDAIKAQEAAKKSATSKYLNSASGDKLIKAAAVNQKKATKQYSSKFGKIDTLLSSNGQSLSQMFADSGYFDKGNGNGSGYQINTNAGQYLRLKEMTTNRNAIINKSKLKGSKLDQLNTYMDDMEAYKTELEESTSDVYKWLSTYMSKKKISAGLTGDMKSSYNDILKGIAMDTTQSSTDMLKSGKKTATELTALSQTATYQTTMKKLNAAKKEYENSWGSSVDKAKYTENAQAAIDSLDELADKYKDTSPYVSDFLKQQQETFAALPEMAASSLPEVVNQMQGYFDDAKGVLAEFQSNVSGGDYYTGVDQFHQILGTALDGKNNIGRGSQTFWKAAEQILGESTVRKSGYDFSTINAKMQKLENATASSKGAYNELANRFDNSKNIDKNGNIRDEYGDKIGKYNRKTKKFNFDADDTSEIAKALGVSTEFFSALLDNAHMFTNIDTSNRKDIYKSVSALGKESNVMTGTAKKKVPTKYITYDKLKSETGLTGADFDSFTKSSSFKRSHVQVLDYQNGDVVKTTKQLADISPNAVATKNGKYGIDFDQITKAIHDSGGTAGDAKQYIKDAMHSNKIGIAGEYGNMSRKELNSEVDKKYKEYEKEDSKGKTKKTDSENLATQVDLLNEMVKLLGGIPDNITVNIDSNIGQVNDDIKKIENSWGDGNSKKTQKKREKYVKEAQKVATKAQESINDERVSISKSKASSSEKAAANKQLNEREKELNKQTAWLSYLMSHSASKKSMAALKKDFEKFQKGDGKDSGKGDGKSGKKGGSKGSGKSDDTGGKSGGKKTTTPEPKVKTGGTGKKDNTIKVFINGKALGTGKGGVDQTQINNGSASLNLGSNKGSGGAPRSLGLGGSIGTGVVPVVPEESGKKDKSTQTVKVKVKVAGANALNKVNKSLKKVKKSVKAKVKITVAGYATLKKVASKLKSIAKKKIKAKISVAVDGQSKISKLNKTINQIPKTKTPKINIKVNDKSKVESVKKTIDGIKSKSVTLNIDVTGKGSNSNKVLAALGITPAYSGTKNAASGDYLVGELGPETLVSNGRAYIVGQNGPEVVNLNSHDIVLTHEETKHAFGNGVKKYGSNGIKAAVSGKLGSGSSSSGGSSSSSSKSSSKNNDNDSGSKKAEKETKKTLRTYEKAKAKLDHILAMGYISQATYYRKLAKLYSYYIHKHSGAKLLKGDNKKQAQEDRRQAWYDAWQRKQEDIQRNYNRGYYLDSEHSKKVTEHYTVKVHKKVKDKKTGKKKWKWVKVKKTRHKTVKFTSTADNYIKDLEKQLARLKKVNHATGKFAQEMKDAADTLTEAEKAVFDSKKSILDTQLSNKEISGDDYLAAIEKYKDKYLKGNAHKQDRLDLENDVRDSRVDIANNAIAELRKQYDAGEMDYETFRSGLNSIEAKYETTDKYREEKAKLDNWYLTGHKITQEDHDKGVSSAAATRDKAIADAKAKRDKTVKKTGGKKTYEKGKKKADSKYSKGKKHLDRLLKQHKISKSTYNSRLKKLLNEKTKTKKDLAKNYKDYKSADAEYQKKIEEANKNYSSAKNILDADLAAGSLTKAEYEAALKEITDKYTAARKENDDTDYEVYLDSVTKYIEKVQQAISDNDMLGTWAKGENEVTKLEKVRNYLMQELLAGKIKYSDYVEKDRAAYTQQMQAEQTLNNNRKSSLNSLIDMTKEMVKQEKQDQLDALQEQLDKYQKIVDKKKESIQLTESELSYQEDVVDKVSDISDLKEQQALLELDNSREGQAKLKDINKQLADKQKELYKYQHEYAVNQTNTNLDKQTNQFQQYYEEQQKSINDFLNSASEVLKTATDLIDSRETNDLWNKLYAYNREHGDAIDATVAAIKDNAAKVYDEIPDIAKKLGMTCTDTKSILETLTAYTNKIDSSSQSGNSSNYKSKESLMTEVKAAAATATTEADWVKIRNLTYQINAFDGYENFHYNPKDGHFYNDNANTQFVFHSGLEKGFVGDNYTPAQNEVYTLLTDDELVFNKSDQLKIGKQLSFIKGIRKEMDTGSIKNVAGSGNSGGDISINVSAPVSVEGATSDEILSQLENVGDQIAGKTMDKLNSALKKSGFGGSATYNMR